MQVTINQIFREQKQSKTGKPYTSLRIKTMEHGDKWLSGFGNLSNKNWQEGSTVEIQVEEKGQYLNFKDMSERAPSKTWDKINELDDRLSKLEALLIKNPMKEAPADKMTKIESEMTTEDLPF